MMRQSLIYLSQLSWAQQAFTHYELARRMAKRFVAGDTIAEAIHAIRELNAKNILATLDHLGESVTTAAEANRAADDYVVALEQIAASGARANVSLKLTQFGLDVDAALCAANVRRVIEKARDTGNFVRIDMEGTPHIDRTLALFKQMRAAFDNVGLVLQAYLYRTEYDARALVEAAPRSRIRLCKGAYNEPAEHAYPRKADTDANYVKLAHYLLERAHLTTPGSVEGRTPALAAFATHDEKMIAAIQDYANRRHISRENFEFQMLYGIKRDLQEQLAKIGYTVRVYVPYGTEWYPYFMRRLAERPANVWFIARNLLK
jgi:proline dehydrogenase